MKILCRKILIILTVLSAGAQVSLAQEEGERPPGGRHPHRPSPEMRECLEGKGVTLTKPEKGQRPQLTEEQKTAMKECREQLGETGRPYRRTPAPEETSSEGGFQ